MRWIYLIAVIESLMVALPAAGQANGDRATYGSRLTKIGGNATATASAKTNRRLDTRINSRIDNRIDRFNNATSSVTGAIAASQAQLAKQPAPVQSSPQFQDDPQ